MVIFNITSIKPILQKRINRFYNKTIILNKLKE